MGEYSEANFVALFQGYRLKEAIIPQGGRVGENKTLSAAPVSSIMVANHRDRSHRREWSAIETQIMCRVCCCRDEKRTLKTNRESSRFQQRT